jgi:hypothetical protein
MRNLLLFLAVSFCFFSCSGEKKSKDLSGTYRNIDDYSDTKIGRINDTDYVLVAPDGRTKVSVKRTENILSGTYQGLNISCEFNSTYDTIVNKSNGKVMFTCKKVSK